MLYAPSLYGKTPRGLAEPGGRTLDDWMRLRAAARADGGPVEPWLDTVAAQAAQLTIALVALERIATDADMDTLRALAREAQDAIREVER